MTASVITPIAPAIHRCCAAAPMSAPGQTAAAPIASIPAGTNAYPT